MENMFKDSVASPSVVLLFDTVEEIIVGCLNN